MRAVRRRRVPRRRREAGVLLSDLHRVARPPMTATVLATPKQLAFIGRLVAEGRGSAPTGDLSHDAASQVIDALLHAPRTAVAEPVAEPGIYQLADGTIYKVPASKQDSTPLYAKRRTPIRGDRLRDPDAALGQWAFVYAPAPVR